MRNGGDNESESIYTRLWLVLGLKTPFLSIYKWNSSRSSDVIGRTTSSLLTFSKSLGIVLQLILLPLLVSLRIFFIITGITWFNFFFFILLGENSEYDDRVFGFMVLNPFNPQQSCPPLHHSLLGLLKLIFPLPALLRRSHYLLPLCQIGCFVRAVSPCSV